MCPFSLENHRLKVMVLFHVIGGVDFQAPVHIFCLSSKAEELKNLLCGLLFISEPGDPSAKSPGQIFAHMFYCMVKDVSDSPGFGAFRSFD